MRVTWLCLCLACSERGSLTVLDPGSDGVSVPEDGGSGLDVEAQVIVIGAGIAGLTVAWDLMRAGTDVVVLEARDRVGGRTWNQPMGDHFAEAGGQWIAPSQTAVIDLMDELGVGRFPTHDAGASLVRFGGRTERVTGDGLSNAGREAVAGAVEELERLMLEVPLDAPWEAPLAEEWDGRTVEWWLNRNLPMRGFFEAYLEFELGIESTLSASAGDVSLLWFLFYLHSAGGWDALEVDAQALRVDGGAGRISSELGDRLGNRVVLEAPVEWIDQRDPDAVIVHAGGVDWHGERVVVAMMPSTARRLTFAPELPPDRRALMAAWPAQASGVKFSMLYDRPFWRDDGLSGVAFSDSGAVAFTMDNSPEDASVGVLVAFGNEDVLDNTLSARERQAVSALSDLFGPSAADVLAVAHQDWSRETWTTGCVSPLPPGLISTVGYTLRAPVDRVHWAGTETSGVWNGYIDGAVRSGHRAADEVLDAL